MAGLRRGLAPAASAGPEREWRTAARRLSCLARNGWRRGPIRPAEWGGNAQGKKVGADGVAARDQAAKPSPANQSHGRGGIGLGSRLKQNVMALPDRQPGDDQRRDLTARCSSNSDQLALQRHDARAASRLFSFGWNGPHGSVTNAAANFSGQTEPSNCPIFATPMSAMQGHPHAGSSACIGLRNHAAPPWHLPVGAEGDVRVRDEFDPIAAMMR
jgi:hypothetical protein